MSRKVWFSGFQAGDTVTLSASQGGVTRGPNTVLAWQAPIGDPWTGDAISETLTVTVEEEIPDGPQFAPLGVEWRIKVSGSTYGNTPAYWDADDDPPGFEAFDHTYQKIQYVVHTGDSGNYRNAWVGHSSHRNKAFQYGQNPGHVYSEPGTYSVSVYVYDDDGKWGVWTRSSDLVVTNPDDEFDAAWTILLASDGDYTGAPHADTVASANKVTTFDAAVARFNTLNGSVSSGVRICAKAGQTFNEVSRQVTCNDPSNGRLLLDTFGGTAQAEYSERDLNVVPGGADSGRLFGYFGGWAWTIKNWKFDMGFDVASGSPTAPNGWPNANTRTLFYHGQEDRNDIAGMTGARFVYDNVDATGCGTAVIVNTSAGFVERRSGAFLNDCDFYDNNNYVYFSPSNFFALGTRLMDTYGNDLGAMARTRLMGTDRGYRAHPIFVRESSAWAIYIRACFVEARGGWSGQNDETMYSSQPIFRIYNQTESSLAPRPDGSIVGRGKRVYICDSILSGSMNVDFETADSNGTNVVMENNLIVDDPASWSTRVISNAGGRKTFRNNILLSLNVPQDPGMSGKNVAKFETQAPRIGWFEGFIETVFLDFSENERMENLHNTFVMLRTTVNLETGNFFTRSDISTPGDVATTYDLVEGNNVVYAPNVDTPVGPAMDTIDLPAGVRILDVWMKTIWERQTYTLSSALVDGATSPAIAYPNDWYNNATTGADYSGSSGLNGVRTSDGTDYAQIAAGYVNDPTEPGGGADALTIIHDCDASGVVQGDGTGTHFKIENRSGSEWQTGEIVILLDRGTTAMTPDRLHEVDQSELKLYRPATPQPLDAGVKSCLFDFKRNLRPNAGYAISPSGTNAAGAILPAE